MNKMLKMICGLLTVALITIALTGCGKTPAVPENYTETVKTGGELEAGYLCYGEYEVDSYEGNFPEGSDSDWGKYVVYYPADMKNSSEKYPVVLSANGTGVPASRYPAMLKHLASWGFVVIGNEDPDTAPGDSAETTLNALFGLNEDENSIFYQKIDKDNIGIYGHSQGAHCVFNSIQGNTVYKTAVALSPSDTEHAFSNKMPYEYKNTNIPLLMLAGSGMDAIDLEHMNEMFDNLSCPRLFARKTDLNHGEMLYSADGYVTAWFRWQLCGDEKAANAFIGTSPEIFSNTLYQDQKSDNLE